ncbi:nucleotide exchange factor GrpE [Planobispora siamensis]|uniref:GrpE protein n=1 Tax=Planobispora siamensis TaxID=936338 RepID=A0A8J3SK55_9ACTN|nr:nucleotide exchange factor GrpE [Planobispora siamensis]GIH94739.1 hypothetical protein Psi01_53690 [Planobispora siamensis]
MRDRRVLLAMLLLGGLALTGCGSVESGGGAAGSGGGAAATATQSSPPEPESRDKGAVRPLQPKDGPEERSGESGAAQEPGGSGAAETAEGPVTRQAPGPFGLPPLLLALVLAALGIVVVVIGVLLWRRDRTAAPAAPAAWQGGPAGPVSSGPGAPSSGPGTLPSGPGAPAGRPAPAGSGASPARSAAAPPPAPPGAAPVTPPGSAAPSGSAAPVAGSGVPSAPPSESATPPGAPMSSQPPAVPHPGPDPLQDVLRQVAGSGISQALTQQVERLFADGTPGRETLVETCIDYWDQIAERHPQLAGTLLDGLNRAGVRQIVADGQRFDPRLHEAFGTEPTDRPELHDVVAETVKQGYADGDRVLRVPQVAVYRYEPPAAPQPEAAP